MVTNDNANTVSQTFVSNAASADNTPAVQASKNDKSDPGTGSKENKTSKIRVPATDTTAALTDADIVSMVQRNREESYEREQYVRSVMLDCYGQYRNKQDFDDKAPWQSRITYSKAFAAVKHGTANIIKLLTQNEQWLTVEPNGSSPLLKHLAPMVEDVVLKLANTPEMRDELRDALEFSFITGLGVLKIGWKYEDRVDPFVGSSSTGPILTLKTRKEGSLAVNSIDPFHIWFGPRTRNRRRFDFVIEESQIDVDFLKEMAGLENTDGLENIEQVQDQTFFADQQYVKDFARYDKRNGTAAKLRKEAQLWEYWGDVVDPKTQKIVAYNKHILIANRTHILKFEDNPYWDGLPPYIFFGPVAVAGRFPEQGILEMNLTIKDAIDRLAQMQEDHLKFSVVPMLEVEASALENPEGDLQTGISPGKIFYKRGGTVGPAVAGIQFPQLTNASFNAQGALDKEYQRGTFITEQTQGLLDVKGETTATEVQATQLQSTLILSDIAQHIEDTCLRYIAEMVWSRGFQFLDSSTNPTWSSLLNNQEFGQLLDGLPRGVRVDLLKGRYNFVANGLSRAIQRQQNISKYTQFLQTAAQAGPNVMAMLNMPSFLLRVFTDYHFPDPEDLLSPQAQQLWAQRQEVLAAQGDQSKVVIDEQAAKAAGANSVVQGKANSAATLQLIATKLAQMGIHPDQLTAPPVPQAPPA